MPKGNLLKKYHPKGMMKVINSLDSLTSRICQKPLLASNLENTVAPASKARVNIGSVLNTSSEIAVTAAPVSRQLLSGFVT